MTSDQTHPNENNFIDLNELVSLYEASEWSGLSASHLRLLVTRGEIWGKKIGRNWLTTRQSVNDYRQNLHKPGRKPNSPKS